MDLTPYVDRLRADLRAAAAGTSPELADQVERLVFALDPAARLALMEAISEAAAQISADLPAGGVSVRLDGRRLAFVVDLTPSTPTEPPAPAEPTPTASVATDADDGSLSRVTLRLPESVKAQAEDAAAEAGQSLNTWLVGAVRRATQQRPGATPLDLTSSQLGSSSPGPTPPGSRRMTGWV